MKDFVPKAIQRRPISAWVLAGVLALMPCPWGYAQDTSVGLQKATDTQRFELGAEQIDALDRWIEQTRETWQVPGLSVAIVARDQVLLSKGYGIRELGKTQPVDDQTLFAIASNTKAFTADALAILVDEGKLTWDDPVQKHLPWFRLSDPLASNDIRVRDLLCHRSGLGTFSGDLLWWGTPYSPKEILQRSVSLKPEFPFRANYGYSNLMFLAAGEVIEALSGMPWGQFIQTRLLDPLEMTGSKWSIRQIGGVENVATPHKTYLDRSEPIEWMNWDSMAAAGGILSNASDMARWMQFQMRQGVDPQGRALVSKARIYETMQPHSIIPVSMNRSQRIPSTHFRAYGLGWSLADYHGVKLVGHGGGYDGMYSEQLMIPELGFGVVVLTNSMTPIGNAIVYQAIDGFLKVPAEDRSQEGLDQFRSSRQAFDERIRKATLPVKHADAPSHPLESYVGKFRCSMYGDAQTTLHDGKLQLQLLAYPELKADLELMHYDTFAIRWHKTFAWFESGSAHFVFDAQGNAESIRLDVPNDDLWFYELNLKRLGSIP
jgi:CubicO group peptidase (beta-lactamase class C family)